MPSHHRARTLIRRLRDQLSDLAMKCERDKARAEMIMNNYLMNLRAREYWRLDDAEREFLRTSNLVGDWKWPVILRWYRNWGPYPDPQQNPPGTYTVPDSLVWSSTINLEDLFHDILEEERQLRAFRAYL